MDTRRDDWSRREVLGLLGAAGAAALAGYAPAAAAEEPLDCVVTPAQTEGPYFRDERLERADIRVDPATRRAVEGVPLRLRLLVRRVDGAACTPLPGAVVDLWQCDALGVYSDVRDFAGRFDTRGRRFLRGYQVTDRTGAAEFLTIYPGWYPGRAVHVHFKVRVPADGPRGRELSSQLYFDDELTDRVHARQPYRGHGPRDTRNDEDGIYRGRDSGPQLMLRVRPQGQGYAGTTAVGLRLG
ncbi:MAG TPA: twin-arginine translocation pathway signal protein [Thermoanaerobaculia bacterium]|nr:twin-arginine translocation pathway signal protein [Thermoanaerobaculia bacterium]